MQPPIRHLIFDLGGLFIDVYMDRFASSLQQTMGRDVLPTLEYLQQAGVFNAYEIGAIDTSDFLAQLAESFDADLHAQKYVDCWNAILGRVDLNALELIQPLRANYNVVLLSNTNALHVDALEADFEQRHPGKKLQHYFDRVYYSQAIGMRKPDEEVFGFVAHDSGFDPSATLFIDDSPAHLAGAQKLGIQTQLHPQNQPLLPTLQLAGLF